jgi:glycosyltransferase involved in cell wall biosynthesis
VSPIVSVVIPTHNRRDLLLGTIASALAQEDVAFEIVVVDDGSSDGTADAVRALDDARVRLLRHERAERVAASRNHGASVAAGAWLAFLDDDDVWGPGKLRAQLQEAEASRRAWVYAGVVEIDERNRLLGGEPPPPGDVLVAQLKAWNLMPAGCSNVLVRADVFRDAGGFDTALRHLADWDLWLRLAAVGPPACVVPPLVGYRQHARQASLDPSGMIAEGHVLASRHGAALNSIRRWLAWSHLRRGERVRAVRAYLQAAAGGDILSLGRAAVAAVHPQPTTARRGRPSPATAAWLEGAGWLEGLRLT